MFERIKNQLVREYTFMLAAILIALTLLFFGIFAANSYLQQKENVRNFANEEILEWSIVMPHWSELQEWENKNEEYLSGENLFYYIFDKNGVCIRQLTRERISGLYSLDELPVDEVTMRMGFSGEGQELWAYLVVRHELYENGEKIGTIYAGRDMVRYLYILAIIAFLELELILGILLISMRMANKMAERAMIPIVKMLEQQKAFTADASHELRTPISVLLASVETIQRDKKNQFSPFSQEILQDMHQEVHYLHKVTDNLLMMARLDQNKIETRTDEITDCSEVIYYAERLYLPVMAQKQLNFTCHVSENPLLVRIGMRNLQQVLGILLDNAVKYTKSGGKISLEAKRMANGKVLISVADTGIGIEAEFQQRVFERFFRVDKSRARRTGGTGLGLAMAKAIIEDNEGLITVSSELNKGSCFCIEICGVNNDGTAEHKE